MTARIARGLVALTATLVLTGVAGSTVQALDGCFVALSVTKAHRSCCGMAKHDRIGKQRRDCCSVSELTQQEPTSTSSSPTPQVPGAPVVTLPLSVLATVADADVAPHPYLARDGPPDESPPTATTVLLI